MGIRWRFSESNCRCVVWWFRTKPSLKIRTASAIFWIYHGIFRDYSLKDILFRNKTFLFFKIEGWNFQHVFEMVIRETSQNFNSFSSFRQLLFSFFYRLSDWVEILWNSFSSRCWKFKFSILKNKKVLFLRKIFFRLLSISKQKSFVYWPNFQWRFWFRKEIWAGPPRSSS